MLTLWLVYIDDQNFIADCYVKDSTGQATITVPLMATRVALDCTHGPHPGYLSLLSCSKSSSMPCILPCESAYHKELNALSLFLFSLEALWSKPRSDYICFVSSCIFCIQQWVALFSKTAILCLEVDMKGKTGCPLVHASWFMSTYLSLSMFATIWNVQEETYF